MPAVVQEDLLRLFERYASDPVAFCEDLLVAPREWQPEFLRLVAENPRAALKKCRGAGGTFAIGLLTLWYAVTRPNSTTVICAPTWQQLNFFWVTLAGIWQRSKLRTLVPHWELLQNELRTTVPGWRVIGLSAEQGERVEGVHASGGICLIYDEARNIGAPVRDSLRQMLGGHGDFREIAVSTPGRSVGWFYNCFAKDAGRWKTMTIAAADIPRLHSHFLDQQQELGSDDPFFRSQLMGEFSDASEIESVIPYEAVRRAAERPKIVRDMWSPPWPSILGLDPSGRGRDYSIAAFRRGPNIEDLFVLGREEDEMKMTGKAVALAERLHVQVIVIDSAGLGGPIASRIEEVFRDPTRRRVEIKRFNGGGKARASDRFFNLKSELVFHARARLVAPESALTIPSADPELLGQLTSYSYEIRSDGRVRTVDPLPSPDKADAFLLTLVPDAWGPSVVGLTNSPVGRLLLGYLTDTHASRYPSFRKEALLKTSVTIPDVLWKAAKVRALIEERDLADVITDSLRAYLGKPIARGAYYGRERRARHRDELSRLLSFADRKEGREHGRKTK